MAAARFQVVVRTTVDDHIHNESSTRTYYFATEDAAQDFAALTLMTYVAEHGLGGAAAIARLLASQEPRTRARAAALLADELRGEFVSNPIDVRVVPVDIEMTPYSKMHAMCRALERYADVADELEVLDEPAAKATKKRKTSSRRPTAAELLDAVAKKIGDDDRDGE